MLLFGNFTSKFDSVSTICFKLMEDHVSANMDFITIRDLRKYALLLQRTLNEEVEYKRAGTAPKWPSFRANNFKKW